jgi:Fe-S oxidoreductase
MVLLQTVDESKSQELCSLMAHECIACGLCEKSCDFLDHYGNPGTIAMEVLAGKNHELTSFCCHLCNLCRQVCPKDLPIAEMFLSIRRLAVRSGGGNYPAHRRLRLFEKIGNSRLFTGYFLPAGCTTVFFPGCAIPGLHPQETMRMYDALLAVIPQLGIVFDCCCKPSHDLGDQNRFLELFGDKCRRLLASGVDKVVTVCPSCLQIFRLYGNRLTAESAYCLLPENQITEGSINGQVAVHDSCVLRFDDEVLDAVRRLMTKAGASCKDLAHQRETTYCCGEGGGAGHMTQGFVTDWRKKRLQEVDELPLVTLCAGCTVRYGRRRATHLLHLLFGKPRHHRPRLSLPFRHYLNRLLLLAHIRWSANRHGRWKIG